MEMRFRRGDRVKGNPKSRYYNQSVKGGKEFGTIAATHRDNPDNLDIMNIFEYLVKWDWEEKEKDAHYNYNASDLMLAQVDSNEEALEFLTSIEPF